jgi:hypothetical protein
MTRTDRNLEQAAVFHRLMTSGEVRSGRLCSLLASALNSRFESTRSILELAVAHGKSAGSAAPMMSFRGGMQLLSSAGFKTRYEFQAPQADKYLLSARVVAMHDGAKVSLAMNSGKAAEVPIAYTAGVWQLTQPLKVTLNGGRNQLDLKILGGNKFVIKEFTLTPVK